MAKQHNNQHFRNQQTILAIAYASKYHRSLHYPNTDLLELIKILQESNKWGVYLTLRKYVDVLFTTRQEHIDKGGIFDDTRFNTAHAQIEQYHIEERLSPTIAKYERVVQQCRQTAKRLWLKKI